VRKQLRVDDDRIYLLGHSMGAIGSWYLGAKYPDRFAALAVFAGAGNPATMAQMRNIAQFVVHGDADTTVPVSGSRAMVARMKDLGVEHQYIEVPGGTHMDVVEPNLKAAFDFFDAHRRRKPTPTTAATPAATTPAAPPLTGFVTRDAIESFNDVWKGLRAQDYEPEPAAVATIRTSAKDVEVLAVVATWCPDTRRDLPRFFKIADQAQWPMTKMRLLAVDRTKKDAEGLTEKWNVTRVPTFIFIRGGQEIGRVVEKPTTTLEKDIAAIVEKR